jgi:hypothetical protein
MVDPGFRAPGGPTAEQALVDQRLEKVAPITGRWHDDGCAGGGYAAGLLDAGAAPVTGATPPSSPRPRSRPSPQRSSGLLGAIAPVISA